MLRFVERGDGFVVEGDITEGADFSSLPDTQVELDMSGVRRINSTGIRTWLRWLETHRHRVVLANVPCNVVVELSLVRRLCRDVMVRSVWAPYYNPQTSTTRRVLVDATALRRVRDTRQVPVVSCSETGAKLEFDEDERNYFGFLFDGAGVDG